MALNWLDCILQDLESFQHILGDTLLEIQSNPIQSTSLSFTPRLTSSLLPIFCFLVHKSNPSFSFWHQLRSNFHHQSSRAVAEMMSSQGWWDFEATSADDGGRARAYKGMSLISNGVNMTNCYKHCELFFDRSKSIHFEGLIAYWMMAGYLGDHVRSAEEAYKKGLDCLVDLVYGEKILKLSDNDVNMIEFAGSSTNANCRHRGFCDTGNLGFVDLLDLDELGKIELPKDGLLNNHRRDSAGGNTYLNKYSPVFNPTIASLKALSVTVENPSVLLIRGFQLSWSDFLDFQKLETLTVLEISGSTGITFIPEHAFSRLQNLKFLNLSDLPITELPSNFFWTMGGLSWLILRGCSLRYVYTPQLPNLEVLDLSHCTALSKVLRNPYVTRPYRLQTLQMLDISYTPLDPLELASSDQKLTHLYLRGSKVKDLSSFDQSNYIQVLDLSDCSSFTELNQHILDRMTCLIKLDLSWTKVKHLPSLSNLTSLRELSLSGLELDSLETLVSLPTLLVELDLSGLKIVDSSSQELTLDFLQSLENLQILNLSQTSVSKLPDLSKLVRLKVLLLANCQLLKIVPDVQALTNLETLDLSLPNDSSSNIHPLEIETQSQRSVPKSLRKLILTNRSSVQKLFPLTTLGNVEFLDLCGTDVTGWDSKLEAQQPEERIPKPVEIHIVSVDDGSNNSRQPNQPSGFDHFEEVFTNWDGLISDIQKNLNSAMAQEQVEMLDNDLKYIQENFGRLKSSSNWKSCKEFLQELVDDTTNLSTADFAVDSANFNQLRRKVVKLKLLVPRKQTYGSEALEITKKKDSSFRRRQNKEYADITDIIKGMQGMEPDLLSSYNSLSTIQKNCLLCFSIFPYNEDRDKNTGVLKGLVIKKKILIYWWVGEGFIDPYHAENIDPELTPNQNPHVDTNAMSTEIGGGRKEANEQVSAIKAVKKPKTVEEIGKQILKVLVGKGFIEPVMKKGRVSGSCCIHPFVHCFVIERAKEENFFDFDQKSGKLTPRFTRSQRACLLKPQDSFPSSCKLWADYISSPKNLESFKRVKALINVDESMIDIKQEWFSKMKNLTVLHLGIWRSEYTHLIEVNDQKFLENLKKMRQLRLFSLQGLPTIMKLPDSVCYLSNLIILDLKECNYLGGLPADIGSLKSLTHLDISNCPLLFKLPKGISLLLKLEVLRGFVITDVLQFDRQWEKTMRYTIHGLFHCKNNEVCTFKDLLKLERLRDLSIVVNISKFPEQEDLKVLKEMKKLCKLKIVWQRSICPEEDIKSATGQESLEGPSRWQSKLKCWKSQQSQNGEEDDREESKHLDSLEKLELWCFPYENAPYWLNPRELRNLKKLYIVGGNLRKLHGSSTDENRWNIEALRLKYLCNLDTQWPELKIIFPQLIYLEKHQWDQFLIFQVDDKGVVRCGRAS